MFFRGATAQLGPRLPTSFLWVYFTHNLVTHTHTHTGMTPLTEGSACRRDRYLQTQEDTPMPSAGLETAIPAIERPQTYTLDSTATGTGNILRPIRNNSARSNIGVSVRTAATESFVNTWCGRDGLSVSYSLHRYQSFLSFFFLYFSFFIFSFVLPSFIFLFVSFFFFLFFFLSFFLPYVISRC